MASATVTSNSDPFKVWDFEKYISKCILEAYLLWCKNMSESESLAPNEQKGSRPFVYYIDILTTQRHATVFLCEHDFVCYRHTMWSAINAGRV